VQQITMSVAQNASVSDPNRWLESDYTHT